MSPNRGAAIQAIVNKDVNDRDVQNAINKLILRDFCVLNSISKWEPSGVIHVSDVYQINTEMLDPANFMPGVWNQNVN